MLQTSSTSHECFVLTDANDYTTLTRPTHTALGDETLRLALAFPIRIYHWKRVNASGQFGGWKLLSVYTWYGIDISQ